jgi:acetyl coenzyme A synthetase (ADP forming)-like protein
MTLPSPGSSSTPPFSFDSDVVLRDGSTLRLRSLAPGDEAWLGSIDRLVSADRNAAFVRLLPSTPEHVSRVVGAAPEDAFALVGELAGRPCAVATYRRRPDGSGRAEVAIAVADAVQGRGIGTRMLETLADIGRDHGLEAFESELGGSHDVMKRVLSDSGFDMGAHLDGGVVNVAISLEPTPQLEARIAARAQVAATASIKAFFKPEAVAVIGASATRGKIGSEVLHNLRERGYRGRLVAVHPALDRIGDVAAYPRVTDVPHAVDLAIVCVPAPVVGSVVDDCIAHGVKALVIITAGFSEIGPDGAALEADILARIRRAGVRLVGPNCMGLLNTDPAVSMNATFSPVYPPPGRIAMSTQSGALGLAILDYARQQDIGLSTFVSIGNKADVSANDLLQYWAGDSQTEVILLYLESFGNPRKFSQIARRIAHGKPIIAVKSGRSAAGARAAASHTGALASSDTFVDALFRQAGVIRTHTIEEMFDVARLLVDQPVPEGRRVAILTNAGGPGILAADACEAEGLSVPRLSDESAAALRGILAREASVSNPVDMVAGATPDQYGRALDILLADSSIDAVLVIFIPPLITRAEDVARAVRQARQARPTKPVLAIFMPSVSAQALLKPIPCFNFPEAAAVALARATAYGEWLDTPSSPPPDFHDIDAPAVRTIIDTALGRGGGWLEPLDVQTLLAALGITPARGEIATTEDAAIDAAARLGFPVVLKGSGPDVIHKTELKAVITGLRSPEAVGRAWRDLTSRLGTRMTAAFVQEMVRGGVEMLVGAVEDPTFGPVIACATGGTLAEILADSQFRLHPLGPEDAADMIRQLRGSVLLDGYRGAAPADRAALSDALLRLSALMGLCPEIAELDVNPLSVLPQGVRALDARVRVDRPRTRPASRRVSY